MLGGLDASIFQAANGLVGRSFTLDALAALAMDDPVAKAGPIVACFAWAWYRRADTRKRYTRRRVLLITLAALFVIAPVMKIVSSDGFSPRPLLGAVPAYAYSAEDGIRALPPTVYRAPQTGDAAVRHARLGEREVEANDLASFPSDHAALFAALAAGIFLALRPAGIVAIGWTVFVTLGTRVATGMHAPVDMVAGAAIGLAMLAAVLAVSRFVPKRASDNVLRWTERWPGWTAAVLMLALLEVANAMGLLKRLAELLLAFAGAGS